MARGWQLDAAMALLRERIGADEAARDWCDRLPELIMNLMERWSLASTDEPARAGYGGIAVFVTRQDHTPAVLKVTFAVETRDQENEVLAAWAGHRAVRLLERDDGQHARLLERLAEPRLDALANPVAAMAIAGELAADLAVPAPPGLLRMADHAPRIAATLSETPHDQFRSLTTRDVDAAVATYRELGADQPDTLLHGDFHGSNVLRSPDGWAVIDPLGMVGEVALEALTMLRDRGTELPAAGPAMLHRQLYAFADGAGAPRSRVVAWTHARAVRSVISGLNDDGLHEWIATQLAATLT